MCFLGAPSHPEWLSGATSSPSHPGTEGAPQAGGMCCLPMVLKPLVQSPCPRALDQPEAGRGGESP